jgi:hypothetical protein
LPASVASVIVRPMPAYFYCPYLDAQIQLTDEREGHIRRLHPEVLTPGRNLIAGALSDPDLIRRDLREPASTLLFPRWHDQLRGGRHVIVSVVSEVDRHWIVTAFSAQWVEERDIEWERP